MSAKGSAPRPAGTDAGRLDKTSGAIVTPVTDAAKRLMTLRAMAALRGAMLHRLDGGGYLLVWTRGGIIREVPDLDEVEAALRAMEGRA